jgi:hypothetical protein
MPIVLANAGIPMIFWQMPIAAAALLPVVGIEALIAWPILKQRFLSIVGNVFMANAISTFVGIPLAWIGMVIVNLVATGGTAHEFRTPMAAFKSIVLQASWLIPYEHQILLWLVPAATLVLLVPYFFVSVVVERWWLRRQFREVKVARIATAAWIANAITYGGLAVYTVLWLRRALAGEPAAG